MLSVGAPREAEVFGCSQVVLASLVSPDFEAKVFVVLFLVAFNWPSYYFDWKLIGLKPVSIGTPFSN